MTSKHGQDAMEMQTRFDHEDSQRREVLQGAGMARANRATAYAAHREYVLAVLSRRCGWLEASEREAIMHDAFVVLLEKERAGELDVDELGVLQVRAFLARTAVHKALDEGKRAERRLTRPFGDAPPTLADGGLSVDEQVATEQEEAQIRELVDELPERQRQVVVLRFFAGCTPLEVQRTLGIGPRVYRRELGRAMKALEDGLEAVREGRFCDRRRSLVLAYKAGVAGPGRASRARRHLAHCPACATMLTAE